MRKRLTQERLKRILRYDPETGLFIRVIDLRGRWKSGTIAGSKRSDGYITISVYGFKQKAHRLAFLWMEGYLPENGVDHIDRDPSNNKWENLREVSQQCNMRNCKVNVRNKSGVTGVHYSNRYKKWAASIRVSGVSIALGYFATKKDAAKSRWDAEVKYGFPNCNSVSSAYQYLQNKPNSRNNSAHQNNAQQGNTF